MEADIKTFEEYLKEIAMSSKGKSSWMKRTGDIGAKFPGRSGRFSATEEPEEVDWKDADKIAIPIHLSYAVYNVFQKYWNGQNDPLYAVLSRRGNSVDWKTVNANAIEIDRLKEVAEEILRTSDDENEKATADQLLQQIEEMGV